MGEPKAALGGTAPPHAMPISLLTVTAGPRGRPLGPQEARPVRTHRWLHRKVRLPALLVALASSGLLITAVLPAPPAAASVAEENAFVSLINADRAAAGARPLAAMGDLTTAARGWSAQMAPTGTIWHSTTWSTQFSGYSAAAQNVGEGPEDVQGLHTAFMNSPEHRVNILNPVYSEVGIGVAMSGVTMYVTEDFRDPNRPDTVGAIGAHYDGLGGGASLLGWPTTSEFPVAGGAGQHFDGGSMYWSPATGAQEVHGAIRLEWASIGWERSVLGTPDGVGRFNHFAGGSAYWTPATGAHEVHGAIRAEWAAIGWERSAIGYPLTDELGTPDGVGRFNHFADGSVFWTPATGAHEVHGAIRSVWAARGWETGGLGYPTSDEYSVPGGRRSNFAHGSLTWSASTGQVTSGQ